MKLILGDCIDKLKELPDNSVDSIITDPPYGLEFMGKEWDKFGAEIVEFSSIEQGGFGGYKTHIRFNRGLASMYSFQEFNFNWAKECLRVLKPGGHLLAFSGTRTYHRMACAIEDAGFEIRDMIEWVYGSGFPKSLNIGKAVDKLQGNEREWISESPYKASDEAERASAGKSQTGRTTHPDITKGTSEWEGWGTALKPAHEPICMARKPLSEKTVAENCLKWRTGGINIDESRVGTDENITIHKGNKFGGIAGTTLETFKTDGQNLGRFPANLIHDNSEEVRECFPNESERFFKSIIYTAKASKSERNKGLDDFEDKILARSGGAQVAESKGEDEYLQNHIGLNRISRVKNNHPTVKPVKLMEYLITMVTKEGGTVLDPFMGSGTTGVACRNLGFDFIGIEKEEDYLKISEARIGI